MQRKQHGQRHQYVRSIYVCMHFWRIIPNSTTYSWSWRKFQSQWKSRWKLCWWDTCPFVGRKLKTSLLVLFLLSQISRDRLGKIDQLSLTYGQSLQRSSKGKDPSRQTSASHKGSLLVDSCPPWNESSQQSSQCSDPKSIPLPWPQTKMESGQIKRLILGPPRSSLLWRGCPLHFHVSSKISFP